MTVHLTLGPVARARNGVIGRDGALPWRLATDHGALPRADHRQAGDHGPQDLGEPAAPAAARADQHRAHPRRLVRAARARCVCEDFSEAVQIAREQAAEDGADEVCVIGGAALFALALPQGARAST